MRLIFFTLLICSNIALLNGQSVTLEQPSKISHRYFTSQELDSLVHSIARQAFRDNKVPDSHFEKQYEIIKPLLNGYIFPKLKEQFRITEFYNEQTIAGYRDPKKFMLLKNQYLKHFQRIVYNEIYENENLSWALNFNTNDRIVHFHSDVTVAQNGNLEIEETITVYNGDGEGNKLYANGSVLSAGTDNNAIQRGIIRGFPTDYEYPSGFVKRVPFEVLKVTRNGKDEPFHMENGIEGELIYTGDKDIFLETGFHIYTIRYTTSEQLNYFDDVDELKWNVTGNGWIFTIDSASCKINFPENASVVNSVCYTGPQGSYDSNCNSTESKSGTIAFRTTMMLPSYEGFTIGVHWAKGVFSQPSAISSAIKFWCDNLPFLIGVITLLLISIIDFLIWKRHGKDPAKGVIFPLYEPPAGLSPAATGFIYNQKFHYRHASATILDAAVNHIVTIDVTESDSIFKSTEYKISPGTKKSADFKPGYETHAGSVMQLSGKPIAAGTYNSSLASFTTDLSKSLENKFQADSGKKNITNAMFDMNSRFNRPGSLVLVISLIGIVVTLIYLGSFLLTVYSLILFFSALTIHLIYCSIMKKYTSEGRKTMDAIEGFRMFLSTTEKDRYNLMNPPKQTIQLYEKYLPYAVALDVANEWSEQFETILAAASAQENYQLTWYRGFSGSSTRSMQSAMASSFASSFAGTISSSSTPPGSSGGSSGGFSSSGGSGGGGGGGGGGGW